MDGFTGRRGTWGVGETWADIKAGAGTLADDAGLGILVGYWRCSNVNAKFHANFRSAFLFDTSSLPDDATISAAVMSLNGFNKLDGGSNSPTYNVYSSNPASNTAIVAADYAVALWGTTPFSDTPIAYGSWNVTGYNDWAFNAAGIAVIKKTAGDPITKLSVREVVYEVGASTPNWVTQAETYVYAYTSEDGAGKKPKLVVTYTLGGTPDIAVSPTSYDFGAIQEGSTNNTTSNYFTITNASTIQTDQTIAVTTPTWSGVEGWLHNDSGSPGDNATAILANRSGTWGTGDIIVKNATPNFIYENCPASTNYSFGLGLWAPTIIYDGSEKSIVVRVSAVAG